MEIAQDDLINLCTHYTVHKVIMQRTQADENYRTKKLLREFLATTIIIFIYQVLFRDADKYGLSSRRLTLCSSEQPKVSHRYMREDGGLDSE